MTAQIIDGNEISKRVHAEVAQEVAELKSKDGTAPGLAVVLVGDDPASHSYVRRKEKACEEVGIFTETLRVNADVSETDLLATISELNIDSRYNGILVQLPLPSHIDADAVIKAIDPLKDVDGLHPENAGLLVMGKPRFVPATPLGV